MKKKKVTNLNINDKVLFIIFAEAKERIEELEGSLSSASGVYIYYTLI